MRHALAALLLLAVVACASAPPPPTDQQLAQVAAVHRLSPFVDIHAHPSRFHRAGVPALQQDDLDAYRNESIDLVVAAISGDAPFDGGYTDTDGTEVPSAPRPVAPGEAFRFARERLARLRRTASEGRARLIAHPTDAEAQPGAPVGLIPALEGADPLEGQLSHLDSLVADGLRVVQLVHYRVNDVGHIMEPPSEGGLTPFGRTLVQAANRRHLLIDLAHANHQTLMETLALSTDPVVVSHSGARALPSRLPTRLLTDEELRAIATHGGVIGVWPYAKVSRRMDDLVAQADYIAHLVGIEHVALGSDLGGIDDVTRGFDAAGHFRAFAAALLARGYDERAVAGVMGGNFLRVWRRVDSTSTPQSSH